jgi:hypothetical protein
MQEKADANMRYTQVEIRTNQEKADAIHKETMAKIDDNQKIMKADRKTNREEMKQKIRASVDVVYVVAWFNIHNTHTEGTHICTNDSSISRLVSKDVHCMNINTL